MTARAASLVSQQIISTNPAKPDEVLGRVAISTTTDIGRAVEAARNAQPVWRALGIAGRVQAMRKFYDYIVAHRSDFEEWETREMGRAISGSRKTIDWTLRHLTWNFDNAEKVLSPVTTYEDDEVLHQTVYEPYGVYGVISPWNFPLDNWAMGALQPLLAGNTVVYKASEEVPMCALNIAEAWRNAGLPHDVFSVVSGAGETGEALARSAINALHFTGSSRTGKLLYKIAAENFIPVQLELGGSDAGIVFDDADIDAVIEPIFWAKFVNSGQICCGLKRLYVQRGIFDAFMKKFAAFVAAQKNGDPQDPKTVIGPLAAKRQQTLLAAQVEDARAKGAKILLGGHAPAGPGAYFESTLMTGVTPNMRAYTEELFGPVLPIWPFSTEDEALRLANASPYGLSAYVFTKDKARFERMAAGLQAGCISHNGIDYSHPANPFGGYKDSGLGRVCGTIGLQQCCQVKTISRPKTLA